MALENGKDLNKVKKILVLYNMIPNLIWSILNLLPISIFCFMLLSHKVLYIFLAVSFIPLFLRNSFLDKLQLGKTTWVYKKLGVHVVNRFAQNGVLINRLIKKKFPEYKSVTNKRSSISRLINQTYLFEKFHLLFFVFFNLVIAYAVVKGLLIWACIILLNNIVYNIYPNLLQQYIRLKLKLFNAQSTI